MDESEAWEAGDLLDEAGPRLQHKGSLVEARCYLGLNIDHTRRIGLAFASEGSREAVRRYLARAEEWLARHPEAERRKRQLRV